MKLGYHPAVAVLFALVGWIAPTSEAQDRVERVTTRDGTSLKAHVWFPDGSGPWPVVLQRFYQAGQFPFGRDRFLSAGYATVHAEIRDADGAIGTRFTRDDLDGYDTVEWISKQTWCNGQVAMYGKSAGGITALAAATARPPHLKAIVPMNNGETWRWGYRAGGAVTLAMAANSRAISDIRKTPWDTDRNVYKFLPLSDLDRHARGKENPLWNQIVENNHWNAFYDGKRLKVENIRIPTLIICGWWDYYTGSAFRCWSTIKRSNPSTDVRVLIGATNHVSQFPPDGRKYPGGREDAAGEAIRWLDYVLKGEQNGVGGEPPIKVFTMGSNKWQRYSSWPPAAKEKERKVYLHNAEKDRFGFLDTMPPGNEPTSAYDYDPDNPVPTLGGNHSIWFHHKLVPVGSFDHSEHEQRSDVLVFSTASLSEDTEVTGPVTLNFWAASDAKDTDWTAILLDVEPDGKPYNVTMGILRARYRNGIFKAQELLTPGAVEQYNLELMPTSYTFKKGHRIRLYLSSSNFPLWDRNPNTGGEIHLETNTQVARQTIYHDSFHPSHLVLPIVAGGGF